MKCPECGRKGLTLETRTRQDGAVRRRYHCTQGHKFTTLEFVVQSEQGEDDEHTTRSPAAG